jgi:amino acid transporter
VAEAVIEERHLLKTLRWYDGFVICLANPGFLLGSLGYSVADLGGWGSMLMWGITAAICVPIFILYSELAAMFPNKSGGFTLYAHEAWRKYTTIVGPIGTFGYWIGWSVVLAIYGLFIGTVVQSTWFTGQPIGSPYDDGWFSTGSVHFGLSQAIALGLILCVWAFNVFGMRISMTFAYAAGFLLLIPLFVFTFLSYITGDFHSANLTYKLNDHGLPWGGWQLAIVWIWIMIWSAGGSDASATFAPEYKDTVRDTRRALVSASLFTMVVYILLPIGLVGGVGEDTVSAFDYGGAFHKLVGGATDFFVVVLILSFLLSMNTATADGGRSLYGISKAGMTVKQLGKLNRFHVPGNAMTLDLIVNSLFVLFVGNIFAILAASNIGYVLAHVFALSGFILLRKDRPDWPRPIKLPSIFVPIAGVLCALFILFTVVGVGWFQNAAGGYGGTKEKVIGFAILAAGVLLFLVRRIVQDRERPHWREEVPETPPPGYFEQEGISVPASGK